MWTELAGKSIHSLYLDYSLSSPIVPMASSISLPSLKFPLLYKSHFLGPINLFKVSHKPCLTTPKPGSTIFAKFNLSEILGGRGLCNGEEGLQQELKKIISQESSTFISGDQEKSAISTIESIPEDGFEKELLGLTESIPEDGFEKELFGLTGGFPGGEKGLKQFIEKNPPPKKSPAGDLVPVGFNQSLTKKPKPPVLPLLMPGMIAIVKNQNSPYYMYCGIVQRITDGKAGVLFEGGNWDRLITFKLNELERREKGPPMVSPRSVVLETMIEQDSY